MPEVSWPRVIEAVRLLNQPMWRTQINELRRGYKAFDPKPEKYAGDKLREGRLVWSSAAG